MQYKIPTALEQGTRIDLSPSTRTPTAAFHPFGITQTIAFGEEQESSAAPDQLRGRIAALEDELRLLRQRVELKDAAADWYVSEALGDRLAMFILNKIAEAGEIDVASLSERLEPPAGWAAFAHLWRAHLVEKYDDRIVPTESGIRLVARLDSYLAEST